MLGPMIVCTGPGSTYNIRSSSTSRSALGSCGLLLGVRVIAGRKAIASRPKGDCSDGGSEGVCGSSSLRSFRNRSCRGLPVGSSAALLLRGDDGLPAVLVDEALRAPTGPSSTGSATSFSRSACALLLVAVAVALVPVILVSARDALLSLSLRRGKLLEPLTGRVKVASSALAVQPLNCSSGGREGALYGGQRAPRPPPPPGDTHSWSRRPSLPCRLQTRC